jgi:hypothetical protein
MQFIRGPPNTISETTEIALLPPTMDPIKMDMDCDRLDSRETFHVVLGNISRRRVVSVSYTP